MNMLYNNCEFESYSSTTSPLEHFSSEDFVCFKSTNEASDELLEALQDDKTRLIGLYGKRGSGKTTLVQVVGRILVILDDVREMVDPEDFGIPCNDNRCKVLLTSRQRLQEPTFMECQGRMIHLNALSKDEAWTLLQKYSDINDESPSDILNVALEIVNECEGLHSTIKD
ncbi:disease resistance protein, partial [Trifolium medium]|nr:disease resistance protein [Trifolium medium]